MMPFWQQLLAALLAKLAATSLILLVVWLCIRRRS